MTIGERERLATAGFDELWTAFWQTEHTRMFVKEYHHSKSKFNTLKMGYFIKNKEQDIERVDLAGMLRVVDTSFDEAEWGFPKGRRAINEDDLDCALREFKEETGVDTTSVTLIGGLKPFEEVFTGMNKVRYKHVYYLSKMNSYDLDVEWKTEHPKEINEVGWFTCDGVLAKLRRENIERREMFKRVHTVVQLLISGVGSGNGSGNGSNVSLGIIGNSLYGNRVGGCGGLRSRYGFGRCYGRTGGGGGGGGGGCNGGSWFEIITERNADSQGDQDDDGEFDKRHCMSV